MSGSFSRWWATCVVIAISLAGCGDDDDDGGGGGGGACGELCSGAGFEGGEEMDYGEVIECQCSGSADGIEQADCTAYCAGHDISSALLSSEGDGTNNKCVCDGTQQ
jgi:hypothetical protein